MAWQDFRRHGGLYFGSYLPARALGIVVLYLPARHEADLDQDSLPFHNRHHRYNVAVVEGTGLRHIPDSGLDHQASLGRG